MRKRLLTFFISLITCSVFFAQQDSVIFPASIKDGIYLTYADFRWNNAIAREQVVSDIDREQQEFIGKVMDQDKLTYKTTGETFTQETKNIWGFFQNQTLYINFNGDFYRIPVFGSVCYLVATVTVINSGFYDPMFGYGSTTSRTKEIREFIMNFYDGKVVEFTMDKAEALISRDSTLYAEYKDLGRRKQKDQVYRYIRKYNDLHPVYFLKSSD